MLVIPIAFVAQWYLSLFSQTFFLHRYSAHAMFTMSKFWERFFFVFTFITQGSNYLSAYGYGVMHRMHHAFADTEHDPHSPKFSRNIFTMMWDTYKKYNAITYKTVEIDARFTRNVPEWLSFDRIASNNLVRIAWIVAYIGFYVAFATTWWHWLFLPASLAMAPLHGAIINWFAHKVGYRTFEMSNTSTNFLPIDVLMMGESYHNNHHRHDQSPNFGHRWHEIDPTFLIIKCLDWLNIIRLKPVMSA
jgi:stearoyl-CoA desaturase (Delta-9 desaturase)